MSPRPKRILLVAPELPAHGGGEAVGAAMIQSLRGDHELSLLAWRAPDLAELNRQYGTSLAEGDVRIILPGPVVRGIGNLVTAVDRDPMSIQRWNLIQRMAKGIAPDYDLVMGWNNEMDVGTRAVQYIHYPYLATALARPLRPWRLLSGFSRERMLRNVTLANSHWTAERIRERYGIDARVLYPPVIGAAPDRPWEERENAFVSVGRLSAEKRLHEIIDIVAGVRAAGHDVGLTFVGRRPKEDSYLRKLEQRVDGLGPWVRIEVDVGRRALWDVLSRHRYGIHAMPDEHFGIGVAEMVRAGCVTFIPDDGGQTEILEGVDELHYRDDEDAVRRIGRLLDDDGLLGDVRRRLSPLRDRFGLDRFAAELRDVVDHATATPIAV